jgi:hypothetical protein
MKPGRINVAHEAPVSIMEQVQQVTDYDYALSVCFDKVDGYFDFFRNAKKKGRWVLLDNGIFEEGVAMEAGLYADWVVTLQPNEYIVPDVLENAEKTMSNFDNWLKTYGDLPGRRIGVAQGKTLKELVECYKFMSDKADKIAISFDYSLYLNEVAPQGAPAVNKWIGWVRGRQYVLEQLYMTGILNAKKPHHLLGASLPAEFGTYTRVPFGQYIESLDTSNPVVYAIKRGQYPSSIHHVSDKISQKLKDLITVPKTDKLVVDAVANITQFRTQNNL